MNVFQATVPMMRDRYWMGDAGNQTLDLHGLASLVTWVVLIYVLFGLGRLLWRKGDKLK